MSTTAPTVDRQLLLPLEATASEPVPSAQLDCHVTTLGLLNELLGFELVAELRHRRHHLMARDIDPHYTGAEFLERANASQHHVDMLVARIRTLGGEPDLSPSVLNDCLHTKLMEDTTLSSLVAEDLLAQEDVINSYRNFIRYLGERDLATRKVLAMIMALEQQHKDDFARRILHGYSGNGIG